MPGESPDNLSPNHTGLLHKLEEAVAPNTLLILMLLFIFVAEAAVMFFLPLFHFKIPLLTNLADSFLLTLLLIPCLYFLMFRPMKMQINKYEASQNRYKSLTDDVLDHSTVGIFILDAHFNVVWINRATEEYFGLKRKDILSKNKRTLVRNKISLALEDPEHFARKVLATYDNNTCAETFECHVLPYHKRKERWLEHRSQPIPSGLYAGGRIEQYYDITEAVKSRKEVARYKNRLEELVSKRTHELESTNRNLEIEIEERKQAVKKIESLAKFPSENPYPVLRFARDSTVLYANEASQMLLDHWNVKVGQSLNKQLATYVADVLDSDSSKEIEADCDEKVLLLNLSPVQKFDYVNIYGLDITERKRLEADILKMTDMVQGSIGRDLHDGLLQQLSGIAFFSDTLVEKLSEVASPSLHEAQEISDNLRSLMTWVRDLAKGLYPTDLGNLGLPRALERLANTACRLFGIAVLANCDNITGIPETDTLHLYRIAQEAINNAVKHGNAKKVSIKLAKLNNGIALTINDDGMGFAAKHTEKGIGLESMQLRAKALQGIVNVHSESGKGTTVTCLFSQ